MQAPSYKLESFEGPLDLLLTLISKNKMNIEDIQISLICEQYLEYIADADSFDMKLAAEFILMASQLMLIKSKMLLAKPEEPDEDPRKILSDALVRYRLAKAAAVRLAERHTIYGGRMVKDTDEISVDRTYVAEQSTDALRLAYRRVKTYMEAIEDARAHAFTPMISKRIISVDVKINRIVKFMERTPRATLGELLRGEESVPDNIAAFIAVLELVRIRRLILIEDPDGNPDGRAHGLDARFVLNTDESTILREDAPDEPKPTVT